ncbi:sodium:proton antiporter [bacterium 336/3]|nr:sodium:proton antiporter [bacterium 336/3]
MKKGKFIALLPLLFFIGTYFSLSLYFNDFYKVPVLVIFLISLFIAFLQFPKVKFDRKLKAFAEGAGDENILLMIVIFLLAGIFGQVSKDVGAISATIHFTLKYLPPQLLIAGLFLVASFISIALGTSVGTIAALAPIAVGLNENIEGSLPIALAAVVGGSMLGDNLSFVSDTTIAATRTQGVNMKDKFKVNFKIILLPALITFTIYAFSNINSQNFENPEPSHYHFFKVIPYLGVFIIALLGVNVIWTLLIGIISYTLVGIYEGFSLEKLFVSVNQGMGSMFELSILCLIIGGVVGIIRLQGGIDFLLEQVFKRIDSPKKAELGIFFLTGLINVCIANNTITIVIVGPLAKEISLKYNVAPKRSASILDTVSCFVQGIIPYGAQILTALAIASMKVSPLEVIQYLYYPILTGIFTLLFTLLKKKESHNQPLMAS